MSKEELKSEVLLVSKYCHIIMQILNEHTRLSVNKMLFFAFLLRDKENYWSSIYTSKTTNDIVIKAISQISGKYSEYCKHIKYIVEAMHLLIGSSNVVLKNNILIINNSSLTDEKYEDNFLKKAIEESRNYSDRQFLKEVMNNV